LITAQASSTFERNGGAMGVIKNPNQMKTTLTTTHRGDTIHLKSIRNGVIETTTDPTEAKQFANKAEAVQFTKDNKSLLNWKTNENY
jgi:hypothetical protein